MFLKICSNMGRQRRTEDHEARVNTFLGTSVGHSEPEESGLASEPPTKRRALHRRVGTGREVSTQRGGREHHRFLRVDLGAVQASGRRAALNVCPRTQDGSEFSALSHRRRRWANDASPGARAAPNRTRFDPWIPWENHGFGWMGAGKTTISRDVSRIFPR